MKIYFAGSVRAGRSDQKFYYFIISELKKYGTVLTEHLGNESLSDQGELGFTDTYIFERDLNFVKEADVFVGEVTTPSLGVGYEIGQADFMNKSILLLYRQIEDRKLSVMLSGNLGLKIVKYNNIEEIRQILAGFF